MAPNPITYVKESKAEFDKVIWPTRREILKLSAIVAIGSILIGAYIAGIDSILTKITETFLR